MRYKWVLVILVLLGSTALGACSSVRDVQVARPGDTELPCEWLAAELAQLALIEAELKADGTTPAAGAPPKLYWLPGVAYTFSEAAQATEALERRRAHLTGIYSAKQCR